MIPKNENITYSGGELMTALEEIEIVLISLHRIHSYYAVLKGEEFKQSEYEKEICQFIDKWRVERRLSKVRRILSARFDNTLGDDDMDDLERAFEQVKIWGEPGDMP